MNDKDLHSLINSFKDEFFWVKENTNTVYFSESIEMVTGYTYNELKSLDEIILEDDLKNYRRNYNSVFNNLDSESDFEFRIRTKDDKVKWVKESIKIFFDDKTILKIYGRVKDITFEKLNEIELKKINTELRDQNTAKDSFLNLLSHDLKSPFTSILGFTEILLKETSLTQAEKKEYLTYLYSSSERLLKLINYLMDWSRLRSGELKIEQQKIDLYPFVYKCVSSLTGTAVRKNIDLKIDVNKSLKIFGDERLLDITVTNLISNAIKFSNKESKVFIKAEKFNNDFIELFVTDEGTGIPEDKKINLFKIENMVSAVGTDGEKGTGFCLTLSKEIIEKHGGEIWFYSEENKGSEFHITIPALEEVILIIEKDEDKLVSLIAAIKKTFKNLKVITAKNAKEAINVLGKMFPSIVILPHHLSFMNGVQLLNNIVSSSNSEIKVIVITESISSEEKNSYKKFNKVIFLEKTIESDQVINALQELIN
ncbi:MAG TPA: ATP-binding protein [Ignavibacteriaceae bacterium]|nr:ATP-binding protein [Ignavibacteriaceae bacterium]